MPVVIAEASNVSQAWLNMLRAVNTIPGRKTYHAMVHISDPTAETPYIRQQANRILTELDYATIETVANTIFPQDLARRSRDHEHLAERYIRMYERIRQLRDNRAGTYFGRLVEHPYSGGFNQLSDLIRKLREERNRNGPITARYEISYAGPGESLNSADGSDDGAGHAYDLPVYTPNRDNKIMGFPCLSHVSFQLDRDGSLHALAVYRSQYLIQRGYGNYLGLGRLLRYISDQVGLRPGQLSIVAGYAQIETGITKVNRLLADPSVQD